MRKNLTDLFVFSNKVAMIEHERNFLYWFYPSITNGGGLGSPRNCVTK